MLHAASERRTNRRAPIDVLANRFLDGYPYLCRATDISARGMRLRRFNEPEASNRYVGLQFQLPGCAEILTASGEVIFRDDASGALGVRFTHLPAAAAAAIERYLGRP